MTVGELIARLEKCPKEREVRFFVDWHERPVVTELSRTSFGGIESLEEVVLIGNDIPAELFVEDYKYQR